MIDVTIDAVIERTEALSLRWSADPAPSQNLTVVDKNSEAEGITSFHLAPAEGDTLPPFQAGQHLPIALEIPAHDVKIRRSYSLSGKPGENTYRITVKREPGGTASQFLHDSIKIGDTIEARPPAGDFLIPDSTRPLVLVSVGVGLTPMMAMLHRLAQQNTGRQVWFVHGARNGRHHALSQETDRLISATRGARKRVFFSQPDNGDLVGRDFEAEGRVTAAEVLALDAGSDALYMLCGPAGFVTDLKSGLEAAGIDGSQIHYETFGSA
jgi:ferredoxin-NADP reductase